MSLPWYICIITFWDCWLNFSEAYHYKWKFLVINHCVCHNTSLLRWLKENKNVLITKIREVIHINVKIWYRKRVMQLAQVTKKNIEVLIRATVWNNSTIQHFILKCNYITHEAGCYSYNYHHIGKIRRLHISNWRSTPNPQDL